jgi:NADH pyrophosphatase NudC (nudix superfamily)
MRTIFVDLLVLAAHGELSWSRQAKTMTPLYLSRKLCPKCGKPMTAVPDDVAPGRPRYVCLVCEDDPLRDPAARKWAESPLRPPAK